MEPLATFPSPPASPPRPPTPRPDGPISTDNIEELKTWTVQPDDVDHDWPMAPPGIYTFI
jgi:hypothetical protein